MRFLLNSVKSCAVISAALSWFFVPMSTDYCITIASVSSLSLSRSPKGSASLAFQRSSQSEEIYTCPNITFNMCEVK
jgi:hypothetical protein